RAVLLRQGARVPRISQALTISSCPTHSVDLGLPRQAKAVGFARSSPPVRSWLQRGKVGRSIFTEPPATKLHTPPSRAEGTWSAAMQISEFRVFAAHSTELGNCCNVSA